MRSNPLAWVATPFLKSLTCIPNFCIIIFDFFGSSNGAGLKFDQPSVSPVEICVLRRFLSEFLSHCLDPTKAGMRFMLQPLPKPLQSGCGHAQLLLYCFCVSECAATFMLLGSKFFESKLCRLCMKHAIEPICLPQVKADCLLERPYRPLCGRERMQQQLSSVATNPLQLIRCN